MRKILYALLVLGVLLSISIPLATTALAASATVTLSNLNQTYDGSPKPVTATTSPEGLAVSFTYNGSSALPLNARSYAVVATITDPNYTGLASGTLVIAKAPSTTSVTVNNATYDNTPHGATAVATGAGGLNQSPQVYYSGRNDTTYASFSPPSDAGDYTGSASFVDGNHLISFDSQDFTIARAEATITVAGYSGIYDGNVHGATGTAAGVNAVDLSGSLNLGSTFTEVPGGIAHWTFTGGPNYNDQAGDANISLTQAPSSANVTVSNAIYDGNPHGGSAVVVGAGGLNQNLTVNYSGRNSTVYSSSSAPTNAGDYTASAIFIGDNNHSGSDDSKDFQIAKAQAQVSLNNLIHPHDGHPWPVSFQTTPVGLQVVITYDGSLTAPIDPGVYAILATINDINYEGSVSGTLYITNNTIHASAGNGGLITPSGSITVDNANMSFNIAANTGNHVADVLADGVSQGARYNYTFNNVIADHTISASFAKNATIPVWDVNGDHVTDISDVGKVGLRWGRSGTSGWIPEDVNQDGVVDIADVGLIGLHWGQAWSLATYIQDYTYYSGTTLTRSSAPVNAVSGNFTQSQTVSGGMVNLTIANAPGSCDTGFYTYAGQLKDLNSILVKAMPGSGAFGLNLWFDVDGSGDYFNWNGNSYTDAGNDASFSALGGSQNGVLSVDSTTQFSFQGPGGDYTLPQLKSGSVSGIDGNTPVAVSVGITVGTGSSLNSTFSSVSIK